MLDKQILENADLEALVDMAIECCVQQKDLLTRLQPLSDECLEELISIEELRDYIIRLLDLNKESLDHVLQQKLMKLSSMNDENGKLLSSIRDDLAKEIETLKKRRVVAGEYMNSQLL